jgi:dTDP-4-dehydrorhamnose reductase
MQKPLIVVSGKKGQLGWELEQLSARYTGEFTFLFTDRELLDFSDPAGIVSFFQQYRPAYFVNCAAYTAVDKAETEQALAYQVNAGSVGVLAQQCQSCHCKLITISTDYVFDGEGTAPYQTSQETNPVNYYGYTKREGERLALQYNDATIIIRTSWVYSIHGYNFVKTMLRLMKERPELKVVDDQVGCPTYAADLALAIIRMIVSLENGNQHFGIYHFSNSGNISWYTFAETIGKMAGLHCKILPQPTAAYPTPAKRPAYSVMDLSAIQKDYGIEISNWETSLQQCLSLLSN